jgi:CRP-like cAMP-binding protein
MKAKVKQRDGMTGSQLAAVMTELKPRFLEGLNSMEASAILGVARRERFSANSLITGEGDAAEHLYIVLDGSARFFTLSPNGKKVVLHWIRAGDMVGGAALVAGPQEYVLSAEAARNSSALVWDRASIRALAVTYPKLLENALLVAYDYLVLDRIRYVASSCQSAPQRLAQVLGYLAKEIGQMVPDGVELHVRNEELAQEANVTIFTVSRLMGEWQRRGLLKKGRGKVLLHRPKDLIRLEA